MTTLADIRARARTDLHDENSQAYRWTDAEIDRHIAHALREFSLAAPQEAKAGLTTTAGSRDLSVSTLTDRVAIEAVEFPTGKYPPVYIRFSVWENTLTMLLDQAPSGGQSVNVHYTKLHTLDATGSSLPTALEDLLVTGAAGYAALEWASFATNRVNVGGEEVWKDYLTWAQERLGSFHQGLARHSRKGKVRAHRLYPPLALPEGKTTVMGP